MIEVLLADDHSVLRAGLRHLLESTGEIIVVGEAATGIEAVRLADSAHPRVVLMDIRMSESDGHAGLDGIEATRLITAWNPEIRVIILTAYDDADAVRDAFRAGAVDYLGKGLSGQQLIASIVGASGR